MQYKTNQFHKQSCKYEYIVNNITTYNYWYSKKMIAWCLCFCCLVDCSLGVDFAFSSIMTSTRDWVVLTYTQSLRKVSLDSPHRFWWRSPFLAHVWDPLGTLCTRGPSWGSGSFPNNVSPGCLPGTQTRGWFPG